MTATERRISSGSTGPVGSSAACGVGLDHVEDHGVGDESRLHDLGHARDDLVARQRLQRGEVDEHRERLMEGADQVLACIGVDAGLAADRGVHHGEQRGRHVHDVDAPQPRGRGESGDVGGRSPAEADHGVLAADADAAQHFPDEADDGQLLTRLGIRDLYPVRVDTLVRQGVTDRLGGRGQRGLMQDRHPVSAVEHPGQVVEQSGPDDHRVRPVDEHVDGHGFSHCVLPLGGPMPKDSAGPRWLGRGSGRSAICATWVGGGVGRVGAWPRHNRDDARCGAPRRRGCGGWC